MFPFPDWLDSIARGGVLSFLGLAAIIVVVRIVGLRSFSKMTSFDFVVTLATGSLLASVATMSSWTSFLQGIVAIVALMGLQVLIASLRGRGTLVSNLLMNDPVLLMKDGEFFEEAMRSRRVSRDDILAKLRGANVFDLSNVRAVVLETTGDISVLHGSGSIDPRLIGDIEGRKRFDETGALR